jgi:hypothetical protein
MVALCQRCETEKLWGIIASKDAEIERLREIVAGENNRAQFAEQERDRAEARVAHLEAALRAVAAVENESCTWPVGAMKMIRLAKEALR